MLNLIRSIITCLCRLTLRMFSLLLRFYVVRRKYIFHQDRKLIRAQVTTDIYICIYMSIAPININILRQLAGNKSISGWKCAVQNVQAWLEATRVTTQSSEERVTRSLRIDWKKRTMVSSKRYRQGNWTHFLPRGKNQRFNKQLRLKGR